MRVRLRPAPTRLEMRMLYPRPHDHTRWKDHLIRVEETIEMGKQLLGGDVCTDTRPPIVADLSCGDAAIARALGTVHSSRPDGTSKLILGDFASGYYYVGPIEKTIHEIPVPVDLFILSETLEHLDDPELVLREIRLYSRMLLLSTPVDADPAEERATNPEHLWAWSAEDVDQMLDEAGWQIAQHRVLEHPAGGIYNFGLWGCR